MMNFKMSSLLLVPVVVLAGCSNENTNPGSGYDRSAMLLNEASQVILPSYENAVTWSGHLKTATQHFTSQPDAQHLQNLRDTFALAWTAWKQAEFITTGPSESIMLDKQIDTWPTNVPVIEGEISGSQVIDDAYLLATGTTRKGFPAVEYLIYPYGTISEDSVLNRFTTSVHAQRRLDYLQAVVNVIDLQITQVYNDWSATGGNYIQNFISLNGTDVGGSATQWMNALIQGLEVVINYKIAIPLGKMSGGQVLPEKAETFRAGLSVTGIENNLLLLKNMYTGGTGAGFDDYLDFVNADYNGTPLSQVITARFDEGISKAENLTAPVHILVNTDPASLDDLYLSLKQLLVLLKTDMSSQLGLLITFSDNDGD